MAKIGRNQKLNQAKSKCFKFLTPQAKLSQAINIPSIYEPSYK